MKNKLKRIAAILLCAVLLAGLLGGCGEKIKVQMLIKNYERACQSADINGILDCYDPNIANPVRSISKLVGVGAESLLNLITPLLGIDLSDVSLPDASSVLDLLKTLKLKPSSYEFSKGNKKCTVRVDGSIEILGSVTTFTAKFRCVERDGNWYVTF